MPSPGKFVRVHLLVKGLIRNLVVWDRKQSRDSGHFWLGSNVSTFRISGRFFSVIHTLFAF